MLIDETGLLPVDYSFTLIDVQLPYEYAIHFQRFFKIIVPFIFFNFCCFRKTVKFSELITVVLTSWSLEKKNNVWGLIIITVTVKGDKYSNCYQNKALLCLSA